MSFLLINRFYDEYVGIQEKRIEDIQDELHQMATDIDNQLNRIDDATIRYLLNDEEIKKSLYTSDFKWTATYFVNSKNKIQEIINQSEWIQGLDIYYFKPKILILSGNYKYLKSYATKDILQVDWLDNMIPHMSHYWLPAREYKPLKNKKVISSVQKLPRLVPDYRGCVAIHIDYDILNSALNDVATTHNGEIGIKTIDGHDLVNTVSANGLSDMVYSNGVQFDKDSAEYVFYQKGDFDGWVYIYRVPSKNVFNQTAFIRESLIKSGVILGISIIALLIVNRLMLKPMNQLLSTIHELTSQVGRGKSQSNNMNQLEDSLLQMSSHLNQLEEDMRQNKQLIYRGQVKNILLGNESFHSNLLDDGVRYKDLVCLIVSRPEYKKITQEALQQLAEQLVHEGDYFKVHSYIETDKIMCLVNFDDSKEELDIIKKKIIIREDLDNVFMASGCTVDAQEEDMSSSYEQALVAFKYRFLLTEEACIDYCKEGLSEYKGRGSRHFILSNLEKAILLTDFEGIRYEISCIVKSLKHGKYTIDYSYNTCYEVCSSIQRGFRQLNLEVDDFIGYDLRNIVRDANDIDELEEVLLAILTNLYDEVVDYDQVENNVLKEEIIRIIEEQLMHDVTLQVVADELGIRYDTFSRTFKKVMGETFSSYVREKKLQKSMELLKDGDKTIKDISTMLGYSSPQYFIKLFKEKYNMTPKKYRDRNFADQITTQE